MADFILLLERGSCRDGYVIDEADFAIKNRRGENRRFFEGFHGLQGLRIDEREIIDPCEGRGLDRFPRGCKDGGSIPQS